MSFALGRWASPCSRRCVAAAALVVPSLFGGCAIDQPEPATEAADELIAADRAFAAAVAEQGIEGWLSVFSDDGVMIQSGHELRGPAAIREAMTAALSDPRTELTWEPHAAEASPDGRLGYTVGRYHVRARSGGRMLDTGVYVTVWRRTDDGWKVAVDIGSS